MKQEQFAKLVADGCSLTDAYKTSFTCQDMKQESIHRRAFDLSRMEKVKARIGQMREEKEERSSHDAQWIRSYVLERLVIESKGDSPSARMKALELLGKVDVVGLFREVQLNQTEDVTKPEDLKKKLEEKLREVLKATA
jgi:hypothetical protein